MLSFRFYLVVADDVCSVDANTDALMQRVLRTAFKGRTIIAVAHRLDTILDFDRVVVMEAGRIAEVGVPGELLQTDRSSVGCSSRVDNGGA